MREITSDNLNEQFGLTRTDPKRYLALCNEFIRQHPSDPEGYHRRHDAWCCLGRDDWRSKTSTDRLPSRSIP